MSDPEYSDLPRSTISEEHLVGNLGLAMRKKLHANRHKGGWQECRVEWLIERLEQEVKELRNLYESVPLGVPVDLADECADVANFAAMILENSCE